MNFGDSRLQVWRGYEVSGIFCWGLFASFTIVRQVKHQFQMAESCPEGTGRRGFARMLRIYADDNPGSRGSKQGFRQFPSIREDQLNPRHPHSIVVPFKLLETSFNSTFVLNCLKVK